VGNIFLGEQDFCFNCIFKTNSSAHSKIWEEQKIWGA